VAANSETLKVFRPRTLAELLSLKKRRPDVVPFAGGTYILYGDTKKYPDIAAAVASMRHLEELKRIHRTERYIELGAGVTLSEIMRIGGRIVPPALAQAIRTIATKPVRSLASIGGNICVRPQRLTLFPVLSALEARLELREHGGSRWIPIARFIDQTGDLDISETEIVTRLRIPLSEWNYQCYRRLTDGPVSDRHSLSFCGLANADRGVLTDFRFVFGSMDKTILRNREIEAGLVGRKVPLLSRDINAICASFEELMQQFQSGFVSPFQASMAQKMLRWFLSSIDN